MKLQVFSLKHISSKMIHTTSGIKCFLLLVIALSACHKGTTIVTDKEAYIIGKAVCANLIKDKTLYTENDLINYVNDIGYSIIFESPRPEIFNTYQFALVESKEPYIWSLVGGFVVISTKIIQICETEDELAAVMAHSLAHLFLFHHDERALKLKKKFEDQFYSGMFIEPLEPEEKEMVQKAFNAEIRALTGQSQEGFALVEELEADKLAADILKKLGYTAHGMETILARIVANTGCLRTDAERINYLKELSKEESKFVHSYRTRRYFENTLVLKGLLDKMLKTEKILKMKPQEKLAVEILMRNTTDKTLTGTYLIEFYDSTGIRIIAEKKEQPFTVLPFDPLTLRNASLVPGATQFWIDIKLK